jgi:CheY-like chemotaxis protein/anti-sigma regulatory factor (Ser/Thr protein kinase)
VKPLGGRSRILIADDDQINRLALSRALSARHEVIEARDGFEAVAKARADTPDLVLMDAQMPGCDGYAATLIIKGLRGADEFLPVVFMTAGNDQERLLRGLSSGGDDFLIKPVNPLLLEGKIQALLKVRGIFQTLRRQRDELETFRNGAERDFTVAEAVLTNVLGRDEPELPGVSSVHDPLERLNGDLILRAILPGGRLRVLLGDFAGHGLSAAIGAIPVAETFYESCETNRPLDRMLREINAKLHRILPRYLFLAACVLELDPTGSTLTVWNGGVPRVVIAYPGSSRRRHAESEHLPFGVLGPAEFDPAVRRFEVPSGTRILVASDGATETRSPGGEMFGAARLEACLDGPPRDGAAGIATGTPDFVAELTRALHDFRASAPACDDVTLFGLTVGPALRTALRAPRASRRLARHALRFERHFDVEALRAPDPLESIRALIHVCPDLSNHRTEIDLVVTELFSNALEHGLLELSSSSKHHPAGFAAYYRERARALAGLARGGIRVSLVIDAPAGASDRPGPPGRRAIIRVADDGEGVEPFFAAAKPSPTALPDPTGDAPPRASGRGLHLVRSLCAEVTLHDGGRAVEAVFLLD